MRSSFSIFRRLLLGIVLALLLLAIWQHNAVLDWIKLRGYQPSTEISHLAATDTMTSSAMHIFYINHPQILASSSQFKQSCPQVEQTIVLGCYQSAENGIFLRQVSDERLNGVKEVTAAHEMLHGAYERLSSSDKKYVDDLLQNFYQNDLHDQRLIDTINSYKKSEPQAIVDEMHSIFGTEILNLTPQLEQYYSRYFSNRQVVAKLAAGYEAEFTSRVDQIKVYENQLNSLKQAIETEETSLSSESSQIQADRTSLDGFRRSNQIDSYNARVPSFNQEVDNYNAGISKLKNDISSYNTIVEQHNQLADELRGLYTSLGTNLSAQPSQ